MTLERGDEILVSGTTNTVTWSAAISGTAPTITDTGVGNAIAQG